MQFIILLTERMRCCVAAAIDDVHFRCTALRVSAKLTFGKQQAARIKEQAASSKLWRVSAKLTFGKQQAASSKEQGARSNFEAKLTFGNQQAASNKISPAA